MGLTVWCVLNGDKYIDVDVYILRDMVAKNMPPEYEYTFRCLSDRIIPGVDCLIPEEVWPGWWSKLLLFKYATGRNLYFDLDVVICGPIERLFPSTRSLTMPLNWAQSGFGGCQSSVMAWGNYYPEAHTTFRVEELQSPVAGNCGRFRGNWGDQERLTELYGNPGGALVKEMGHVYSYKYHCRAQGAPPDDAVVVCFHGDPKPSEVREKWVRKSRYI